jgi:MoaA/NifB/PqqE/SkfB family radical SAM enzyme
MKNKITINNESAIITDTPRVKVCSSRNYNFFFDKKTGKFIRFGKNKKDDPQYSEFGPEILDLEISSGKCSGNCRFCYKSNNTNKLQQNMSLQTFHRIIDCMPPTLTQIAFGICDIKTNPEFFDMLYYSRKKDIIPNFTTSGLDLEDWMIPYIAKYCGAVAVSIVNKEKTYDTIEQLCNAGMQQINIHFMLSNERVNEAKSIIDDIVSDNRLQNLNAIVFLQYKPKGNNTSSFSSVIDPTIYKDLCKYCEDNNVRYGFDSCSAPLFESTLDKNDNRRQFVEPCESGLFSSYINVDGNFYVCSFAEGEDNWKTGLNVLDCKNHQDFLDKVWHNPRLVKWRKRLLDNNRSCPIYKELV